MRLILTEANWTADALPNGAYAVINDRDSTIATHLGALDPGERILYPRITSFPVFKVAGQTNADPPRVKEFVEGSGWTERTEFHPSGTSPVIYDLIGQLVVAQPHTGNGSQGYRYVAPDGRLVTGDATYGPFRKGSIDLFGWTYLSGWLVGQGPEIGCWAYRDGHGFTNLAEAGSRWTMPAACTALVASMSLRAKRSRSSPTYRPLAATSSLRFLPSMSSVTMNANVSSSSISTMPHTPG